MRFFYLLVVCLAIFPFAPDFALASEGGAHQILSSNSIVRQLPAGVYHDPGVLKAITIALFRNASSSCPEINMSEIKTSLAKGGELKEIEIPSGYEQVNFFFTVFYSERGTVFENNGPGIAFSCFERNK